MAHSGKRVDNNLWLPVALPQHTLSASTSSPKQVNNSILKRNTYYMKLSSVYTGSETIIKQVILSQSSICNWLKRLS